MTTISRRSSLGLDKPTGKRSAAQKAPSLPSIDTIVCARLDNDAGSLEQDEDAVVCSPIVPDISIAQRLMIHEQLAKGAEAIEESNRRISEDEARRQSQSSRRRSSLSLQWSPRRRKTFDESLHVYDEAQVDYIGSDSARGGDGLLSKSAQKLGEQSGKVGRRLKAWFGKDQAIPEDGTIEESPRQSLDQRGRRRSILYHHTDKLVSDTRVRDYEAGLSPAR